MRSSDIMKLFAKANQEAGYTAYAKLLDGVAAVYEANEIIEEAENETTKP